MSKRKLIEQSDAFECPICMEKYETSGDHLPRLFPCSHTACHRCVGDIIQNGQLTCPKCRKKNTVNNGVKSFPVNSYIIDTLEIFEKIDEEEFELCKEHKRDLSLRCKDDQEMICQLCHLKNHKGHDVVDVINEHQDNIKNLVKFLRRSRFEQKLVLKKSQNTLTQLESVKKEYVDKFDGMIKEVAKDVSRVKDNIECCEKEIRELVEKEKKVRQSGRVKKEEVESIQNVVSGKKEKTFLCRYFKYQQSSAPKDPCGKLEDKKVSVPQVQVTLTIEVPDYKEGNVSFGLHLVLSIRKKRECVRRENKNAFQWDVYRPLQWPSLLGGQVFLSGRGGVYPGRVTVTPVKKLPCPKLRSRAAIKPFCSIIMGRICKVPVFGSFNRRFNVLNVI